MLSVAACVTYRLKYETILLDLLGFVARKRVFAVCSQVIRKRICAATQIAKLLIYYEACIVIIFYIYRTTKALNSLRASAQAVQHICCSYSTKQIFTRRGVCVTK